MSEMRKALASIVEEVRHTEETNTRNALTDLNCRHFFVEYGEELVAVLRPAAPEGEWVVKPLEWREARISDRWERFSADSMFGSYEVLEWSDGTFGGTMAPVYPEKRGVEFSAPSVAEAKAAVQDDYARRIRAALAAAPKPEPASTVTGNKDLLRRLQVAADGIEKVDLGRGSMRRGYENLLREAHAALSQSQPAPHDLYKTGDPDAPDAIKDRNGEVVLDLCRRCGKGEIEISGPCEPAPQPDAKASGVEGARVVAWRWKRSFDLSWTWEFSPHQPPLLPDAEPLVRLADHNTIVERLKAGRDEARELVAEANNSLYGSQNYFHSSNGGSFDKYHLAKPIEELKDRARSLTTERERSARLREEIADLKYDIERAQNALSLEATACIEAEETGARLSGALNRIASLHMATTLGTHSRARYNLNRARSIARVALRELKGGE